MTDLSDQHVVVVGMPLVDSMHAPLAAPAVLKASLNRAGIRATAVDLNIEILLKINSHPEKENLKKFFFTQHAEDWVVQEVSKILFYSANRIIELKPTIIALSLLTFECQVFTMWLCLVLRQIYPQAKIVMGGPGIKHYVASPTDYFRNELRKKGLVDDWITGDGDQALVEYVKGNREYPGINSDIWEPIKNLDSLPYPDWSDYNFYHYSHTYMPVVDAKGCVRNCEFCDIIEFWQKFQSRQAEKIFDEMLHQIKTYKMYDFDFRSSISNGNLKEFKKLLQLMYDYNKNKYRPEQISWNASFIVRSKSQHPEQMWEQMGATHATLSLGVESLVPHVRKNLGKHFENEDVDYHLEMAKKHNVKVVLMIITGYPTETRDDYEFTKQWFRDHVSYKHTISKLFLSPAFILPGTRLEQNIKTHGIIIDQQNYKKWHSAGISEEERNQYHRSLVELCRDELGFRVNV